MGAPTGSEDVSIDICPRDNARVRSPSLNPLMLIFAGFSKECFLIWSHMAGPGVQVCALACSGVRRGNSLFGEMHCGSISTIFHGSPCDSKTIFGEPSANVISIRHKFVLCDGSRQMNVGGVISGGKIEPERG